MNKNTYSNMYLDNPCRDFNKLMRQYGVKMAVKSSTKIIQAGEPIKAIYYLAQGLMTYALMGSEGTEKVVMILEEGSVFGEGPLIIGQVPIVSVIAKTDAILYRLAASHFNELLEKSPLFRQTFLRMSYSKIRLLIKEIERLSFLPCKDRLYNLLMASAQSEPIRGSWYELRTGFTQWEIGEIIGASRVTVSKLLNELCEEDLVKIVNRKIFVKKSRALSSCKIQDLEAFFLEDS